MLLHGEKQKLEIPLALLLFLDLTAVLHLQFLNLLTLHPARHRVMGHGNCGQFKTVLCFFLLMETFFKVGLDRMLRNSVYRKVSLAERLELDDL